MGSRTAAASAHRHRRLGRTLAVAALALALVAPLALAGSGGAVRASEVSNGLIAVGAAPPEGVWITNPDGSNTQLLHAASAFTQAFSPDGNEILYMQGGGGTSSLRIIGVDGSNDWQIVPSQSLVSADWSQDGSTILYSALFNPVWLVDPDGLNRREIVGLPNGLGHRLSPDGTQVAFEGFIDGGWVLALADLNLAGPDAVEATNLRMIYQGDRTNDISGLSWSPDGRSIVFAGFDDRGEQPPAWDCFWSTKVRNLWIVDVESGVATKLAYTIGGDDENETNPVFAPDGTKVAFAADGPYDCVNGQLVRETPARNLYTINIDGTGLAGPLTDFGVAFQAFGIRSGSGPVWQPCTAATISCAVPMGAPDPVPAPHPVPDPDPAPSSDPDPDPDPDPAPAPAPDPDPVVPPSVFVDVDPTGVHAPAIAEVAARGITTGCTLDRFCPADVVTRAQMASFLARSLELELGGDAVFADVDAASVHASAIAAVAAAGITTGCAPGRFCPGEVVTRAQMASFLARGFDLTATAPSDFLDVPSDSVHAPGIAAVAESGITLGCAPGFFCPADEVTRAQMASFLFRSLGGFQPGA